MLRVVVYQVHSYHKFWSILFCFLLLQKPSPPTTPQPPQPPQAPLFEEYDQSEKSSHLNEEDVPSNARPWYFIGGKRMPVETKKSKKTKRRLAKLLPDENRWSDRITNQLMFVPPNYEKYKASGQFKTILLYNGLGPWNVKQGIMGKYMSGKLVC